MILFGNNYSVESYGVYELRGIGQLCMNLKMDMLSAAKLFSDGNNYSVIIWALSDNETQTYIGYNTLESIVQENGYVQVCVGKK